MLDVDIEKIIPAIEAKEKFDAIVDEVEGSDGLYVLTKNGKPSAVIVGVHHLEKLTGTSHEVLMGSAAGAATETNTTDAKPDTAPPAIDLTNFPTDDVSGNEPDPISADSISAPLAAAPVPTPVPASTESTIAPGITNVAADPTLTTDPFDTTNMSSPTAPRFADGAADSDPASPAPATAPATTPVAEEDPLDFLSTLDSSGATTATPNAAVPTDADPLALATPAAAAPAAAGNPNFSEDSGGANQANTPDDIVTPTQGAFAQTDEEKPPVVPAQPIQQ